MVACGRTCLARAYSSTRSSSHQKNQGQHSATGRCDVPRTVLSTRPRHRFAPGNVAKRLSSFAI
eukprot:scaffold425_cov365-Pavlova_lutheri.AAC.7